MKYNLDSILQQLSAIQFEEIDGNFTPQELWEWMLFDQENSYLNEQLQIHQPSGVPIHKRPSRLSKDLIIIGDHYCFIYIGHQPAYHLQKLKSADDLANLLLSERGGTNSFTTVIIPIVRGKVTPIVKIPNLTSTEVDLINEIQQIISSLHNSNFNELAEQGLMYLMKYKTKGVSQQNMYNAIYFVAQVYQEMDLAYKSDLADEFLDYISGYIGDKKRWVWDNPL